MPTVELTDNEWGQLMSIIGDATWKLANPLLMKIGNQLQQQVLARNQDSRVDANGQEARHE